MKVLILCGGRGTRLGPLTENRQKCMLEINDVPFLQYLHNKITKYNESSDIHFMVDFCKEEVIDYFGKDQCIETEEDASYFDKINLGLRTISGNWREYIAIVNGDTILPHYDYWFRSWHSSYFVAESPGLYRNAGVHVIPPYFEYEDEAQLLYETRLSILQGPIIDIGTPEGLDYARQHPELLG